MSTSKPNTTLDSRSRLILDLQQTVQTIKRLQSELATAMTHYQELMALAPTVPATWGKD